MCKLSRLTHKLYINPFGLYSVCEWVAGVERLPALHYSVDFIFLPFGIMGFIVELWNC